jgi:hypothetical protein
MLVIFLFNKLKTQFDLSFFDISFCYISNVVPQFYFYLNNLKNHFHFFGNSIQK